MAKFSSTLILIMAVAALSLSTGCTSLNLSRLTEGGAFGSKPAEPTTAPGTPTVAVDFYASGAERPKTVVVPLENGMTVQDLIDKSKAGSHFRRMDIDLMRVHAQSGEPHKMAIAFDSGKNRASHSTNYALHPNDRLKITQNQSTVIDDMLASMLGNKKSKR